MYDELTAIVKKGCKADIALCLELDVASSGRTRAEAVENLKDAVREFLEFVCENKLEYEMFPRPVSIDALRDFLLNTEADLSQDSQNLKTYAMEVPAVA